ncbi:MAG: hypothetical protein NC126_03240 [Clostridium sp.]|nr:hypothetical protein [Clostridium sp.]
MFGIFGKKKKEKVAYVHPQLGEVKYGGGDWNPSSKLKVELWDKVFEVAMSFGTGSEDEPINPKQEEAFERVKSLIVEKKHDIEQMVIEERFYTYEESEQEVRGRFYPDYLNFSRTGEECVLYFTDAEHEDWDAGFALLLIPEFKLVDEEEAMDFMGGHSDLDRLLDSRINISIGGDL